MDTTSSALHLGPQTSATDPKVCLPSWRNFDLPAYLSPLYESQDVLADVCDLDIICLEPAWGFKLREEWHRRLVFSDITGALRYTNPGLQPVHLERDYDLFLVTCQT